MFVPPEQRSPRPGPWHPPRPRRALSKRAESLVGWIVGGVLVSIALAPIGGSSLIEALWALMRWKH